jgi:hypothetical protein
MEAPRVFPGETARVTLNVMRPMNDGTEQPIRMEGVVVQSSLGETGNGTSVIALERRSTRSFGNLPPVHTIDTVRISGADVRAVERRQLSWVKTGFIAMLTGAVGYMLYERLADEARAFGSPGG